MILAIDFDGTCVTHDYPHIGQDIGAVPVLRRLVENGHKLILFTMRSGKPGDQAVDWFEQHGIPLYGINCNPDQRTWTQSVKPYAHCYIDDAALGVPLVRTGDHRAYVDWAQVERLLTEQGFLPRQ
jgi:hypothetical protein